MRAQGTRCCRCVLMKSSKTRSNSARLATWVRGSRVARVCRLWQRFFERGFRGCVVKDQYGSEYGTVGVDDGDRVGVDGDSVACSSTNTQAAEGLDAGCDGVDDGAVFVGKRGALLTVNAQGGVGVQRRVADAHGRRFRSCVPLRGSIEGRAWKHQRRRRRRACCRGVGPRRTAYRGGPWFGWRYR